ncbi:MAG: hypothetical protein H3C48_13350, partial [Chitinophagaceae bacterium]|nr:hypothetical protein [Chitinophagaceae bacterium]
MQTVSKSKRIRSSTRQAARSAGSTKEQGKERTVGFAADGFLNHCFLPLYREATHPPEKTKVEKGFFKSLSTLSALCGCELMDTQDKPYPYNILLAHWDAARQLNRQPQEISLHIVQDENGRVTLATRQVYETGNTLYFIPVIPLYRLLQDKIQKQAGELLLSVCAYLYHIAGIPYYRDCYSAMEYYYDMMKDWLLDDAGSYEAEDLNRNFSELYAAEYYGDIIHRKIFNRYHLAQFQSRLQGFKVTDGLGRACYQVAAAAYDLYRQYPERTVFDNITRNEDNDEET